MVLSRIYLFLSCQMIQGLALREGQTLFFYITNSRYPFFLKLPQELFTSVRLLDIKTQIFLNIARCARTSSSLQTNAIVHFSVYYKTIIKLLVWQSSYSILIDTESILRTYIQMSNLKLSKILGSSSVDSHLQLLYRNYLIYTSGAHIIFHNISTDQQELYIPHSKPNITCMTITQPLHTKKQIMIAIGNQQRYSNITIYTVYETEDQTLNYKIKIKLKGHRNPIEKMSFTPDSSYLVSINNKDGSMFLWDVEVGDRLTQNKNSRKINGMIFCKNGSPIESSSGISVSGLNIEEEESGYSLITIGKGHCKIWLIKEKDMMGVNRIQQQQHWMLTGRTIPLSKKLALKQFVDIEISKNYILVLTYDGLLCLISKTEKEEKLIKCIDLMIQKASSLQVYENMVLCGGDNALVKIIDIEQLTLISKLPKPPPKKKQNISKQSEETEYELAENQQFPRCIGIEFSQYFCETSQKVIHLISTLYENQTLFVWKIVTNQESKSTPVEILATNSIISHQGPIQILKVLQYFPENNLTFFATVSNADKTIRIWHTYSKIIHNRESIDLAEIIGVKRNVYCRNLTRILYSQAENPVVGLCQFSNLCGSSRGIICISKGQLIAYSLENYQIIFHENFQESITQIEIVGNLIYLGFQNKVVKAYQMVEQLNKIREIQFQIHISKIKITQDNKFLIIYSHLTHQIIIYSLGNSKILHEEKNCLDFSISDTHILFLKSDQVLAYYHTLKNKVYDFISLKHQISVISETSQYSQSSHDTHRNQSYHTDYQDEKVIKIISNSLYVVVLTSYGRIIVCNFSRAIVAITETNQNINDLAITEGNNVILVGNHGNILIYTFEGTPTFQEMGKQMKNWIQRNDLSWMEGSVWARRKSSKDLFGSNFSRKDSNKNILIGSDSIRLTSSIKLNEELPNIQIKYKSDRNDRSVFNPSDICSQANQIYQQIDNMGKKTGQISNDTLEQISLSKKKSSSGNFPPKKRIFGLNTRKSSVPQSEEPSKKEEQYMVPYRNNLVTSVIHHENEHSKQQIREQPTSKYNVESQVKISYPEFESSSNLELSPEKQSINYEAERQCINNFEKILKKHLSTSQSIDSGLFLQSNREKLLLIQQILNATLGTAQVPLNNGNKQIILEKYDEYMRGFREYLHQQL